jgi:hypothetical protein
LVSITLNLNTKLDSSPTNIPSSSQERAQLSMKRLMSRFFQFLLSSLTRL